MGGVGGVGGVGGGIRPPLPRFVLNNVRSVTGIDAKIRDAKIKTTTTALFSNSNTSMPEEVLGHESAGLMPGSAWP